MRESLKIAGLMAALAVCSFCVCGCAPLDAQGQTVPDNGGGESPADPTIFKGSAPVSSAVPIQATMSGDGWGDDTLNIKAEVRLPQLDEVPQYSGSQVAFTPPSQSKPRQKMSGPKPVVRVYHLSGSCPAFGRFQQWHYNLTPQQRDAFPVNFAPATIDDSLPCPTFHFQVPSGGWYYVHDWNGPDEFLRQYYSVADTLNDYSGPAPRSCTCGPDCQCCPGCSCGGRHGPVARSPTMSSQAACSGGSCGVSSVRMRGKRR